MTPKEPEKESNKPSTDIIIDYYNNIAAEYDHSRFKNSYGCYIDKQERTVLDKLNINPKQALDLPCGTGRLLNYADYGCDASEKMLEIANGHWPGKNLICGDARELPYEDNSFDTVITMHLLMHLDNDTIYKIMKEVHRVLRPNGRWIVDAPSYKRRKLTNCKSENWHSGSSMSIADVKQLILNRFEVKSVHGIMMFPVHRIPQAMRKPLCNLDYRLSQLAPLKEYSSYLIYELWKF